LERYFEAPETITKDEMLAVIRKATISGVIIPMMCGSAFKNKGVQRLLDSVCAFLPSPLDNGHITGVNPWTEKEETRNPDVEEPLAALAFKIATDPFVGRLAFIRVYSGRINGGDTVLNTRTGKKERISRLYQMHSNKQNPKDFIEAGDICAAVGFKDIRTGDTLCDLKHPIVLESMDFPQPVIGIAIEPKSQKDIDKLSQGLSKLAEEDPTFQVNTDPDSGQTVIRGMGELHLEILVDRLRREFKVECNQGAPQVAYKEAISKVVELREVFKKQSGGRGKFADIIVKIEPAEAGATGLQFIDAVKGGRIPKEFIPPVQKGFESALLNGPLAGFPVDSLKVTLLDGSFHAVDSDQLSFEICARMAFRSAASKAGPKLLEPIMKLEIVTPEEYMGEIIGDLNRRRGEVTGMETKGGAKVIGAKVPLAEQFGYVTVLRTLSSGRATSSMEFSHYQEVPKALAEKVLENVKGRTDLL
jgi:elongation factor G